MFEKHEKWIILGLIALTVWYFFKKGQMQTGANNPNLTTSPFDSIFSGSIVNTFREPGTVQPAQGSTPTIFAPAQPATVPQSQIVSRGPVTWYPAPPVLRLGADRQPMYN